MSAAIARRPARIAPALMSTSPWSRGRYCRYRCNDCIGNDEHRAPSTHQKRLGEIRQESPHRPGIAVIRNGDEMRVELVGKAQRRIEHVAGDVDSLHVYVVEQ